jgi:hypothetical protein
MKIWNNALLFALLSPLAFVAPDATAQKQRPKSKASAERAKLESKPSMLKAPVLDGSKAAPSPVKKKLNKAQSGVASPCSRLTPAAIQAAIDELQAALADAEQNLVAHNPAAYAAAGQEAVVQFTEARDKMVALQTWLDDIGAATPFVSNLSAAYSVHWYAREAAGIVAYGEHWAAISAVYNTSDEARSAAEHGAVATDLLADIGADGMRCYVQGYFP